MRSNSFPLTVRIGCHLAYEAVAPTPALFILTPRREGRNLVSRETISFGHGLTASEFKDGLGNTAHRSVLKPGRNDIRHDALVTVSSLADDQEVKGPMVGVDKLPPEVLRFTLPSRYCDSDKLLDFAWQNFGHIPNGLERVQAISDWVHKNIEYRFGSGRPDLSASEVIARRFGV